MSHKPEEPNHAGAGHGSGTLSGTGCVLVALLTLAFMVGGLMGGLGGGGLVLWATGADLRFGRPTPTPTSPPPIAMATPTVTLTPTPAPTQVPPTATSTPTPLPTATPSIADGVSHVLPAVVTVVNTQGTTSSGDPGESRIRGSGAIVTPEGYIVTNFHVVHGGGGLSVILSSGEEYPARLVALDAQQDLALLKVDVQGLSVITWGNSAQVRPGEWAIAVGSALGDFPNSVTVGVISGVDRILEIDKANILGGLIQTDAAINRGNSGGPLVNQAGEVIGINTFFIRESQDIGVAEGLSFAIPSDRARSLIEQWIAADSQ